MIIVRPQSLFITASILLIGCGSKVQVAQNSGSNSRFAASDDQAVIQAAVLSFTDLPPSLHDSWHKSERIAMNRKYQGAERPRSRGDFSEAFSAFQSKGDKLVDEFHKIDISTQSQDDLDYQKRRLPVLLENQKFVTSVCDSVKQERTYKPSPIAPLDSMKWDRRVRLVEKRNSLAEDFNDQWVSVSPPMYSPDGSLSLVEVVAGWSMHHGELVFLLQRESGSGWKCRAVQYDIFP